MTVSASSSRNAYACNGAQKIFPYTFKIFSDDEILVILTDSGGVDATLVLNSAYTVSGAGDETGGNVTTVATYSADYRLTLLRNIALEQTTDYVENDAFPAESHEAALDRLTMITQQQAESITRTFAVKAGSQAGDLSISPVADRALGFDGSNNLTTYLLTGINRTDIDSLSGDHGSSLVTMVSNLGATNKSVLIDIASALTVDLTIPSNINLIWLEGAQVTVSSGKTLTIAGTILAGPFRLWAGAGTVTLSGFDGIHFAEWTGGSNTLGLYTGGTKRGQVDANGLAMAAGATVNEFSIDGTMAGNSDAAVPTEKAVKTYVLGASPQALPGLIITWPLETPPTGYLECDGASLLRATYADLFAVIGVAYGNADGTHFNVPDYRGYFLRGWAHGQTTDPDKAARTNRGDGTTGDHAGTKQVDGFKSHTHDVWAAVGYAGSTVSNYSVGQYPSQASYATGGNETRPVNVNVMFCIRYV